MENQIQSYIYFDEEKKLFINLYETKAGELCRYFILEEPVSKQQAAYISMKRDLTECKDSIEYLKAINHIQQIPQVVKTSLLFASIVLYAKCFTSGEGRGTSLQKDAIFQGVKAEHLDFHNKTMELRNKYLAHAGDSGLESRAMVLVLNPDISNKKVEGVKYAGLRLKDDDSNLDNYISLLNAVILHIDEKMEKLREIVNNKIKKMDIDEIYSKSKLPDKSKFIPFGLTPMKK